MLSTNIARQFCLPVRLRFYLQSVQISIFSCGGRERIMPFTLWYSIYLIMRFKDQIIKYFTFRRSSQYLISVYKLMMIIQAGRLGYFSFSTYCTVFCILWLLINTSLLQIASMQLLRDNSYSQPMLIKFL